MNPRDDGVRSQGFVLVTGAARRGGEAISRALHRRGCGIVVHSRQAGDPNSDRLVRALNDERPGSAVPWTADLTDTPSAPPCLDRLVGVVANASCFEPSHLDGFAARLQRDFSTHVAGHLRIFADAAPALERNRGAIVAVTDIHVERATANHLTYQIAKGALASAVRALAVDLAPAVRVNAVAPGPLEWPEQGGPDAAHRAAILDSTPLGRVGTFDELASAVAFLLLDATFTTGSTLCVDGGRSSFLF